METAENPQCVCLPWLERVSLFSPGWPWTPASASWDPWAAPWCIPPTLASNSKFPQSLICPSDLVKTCSALFLRSKGSYLGHLLSFPFSLVPTFTLVENAFWLLVDTQIRSGDGRGGAALEDASGPDCECFHAGRGNANAHWALWSWGALAFTTSLSCLIADDLSLKRWLLRMGLALPTSNTSFHLSLDRVLEIHWALDLVLLSSRGTWPAQVTCGRCNRGSNPTQMTDCAPFSFYRRGHYLAWSPKRCNVSHRSPKLTPFLRENGGQEARSKHDNLVRRWGSWAMS